MKNQPAESGTKGTVPTVPPGTKGTVPTVPVSVVIPVYNTDKYLRQCLDSVVGQSWQELEILVVDDGSTDGCGRICDEYAARDSRITVFHTDHRGLSAARNTALDRASGEYIAFLDSDDWLESNAIRRFLDAALQTGADVVACRFYQEYVNTTLRSTGPEEGFTAEGEAILRSMIVEKKITEDVWNKFYKAGLFENIRYPEGRLFEDKATTYQLLRKAEKLVYLPDCLVHYRNRENSLSNLHSMNSLLDYWWAFRQRYEGLHTLSEEYHRQTLANCISAVSRVWRWIAGCTREEKRQAARELDEMQRFVREHEPEIRKDPRYARHTKAACRYVKSRNPALFRLLYLMTRLYRGRNKYPYFPE